MHSVSYDHQIFSLQRHGGISRYFCELSSRIGAMPGFNARVVAPLHFNDYLPDCTVKQFAAHVTLPARGTDRLVRAVNQFLEPIVMGSPSIIHRTYYKNLPKPKRSALVVTVFDMIHELFPDEFSSRDPVRESKRIAVAEADHVVCISESTAKDLMRLLNVPRTKISITYLGLSDIFSAQASPQQLAPHPRPYVLYVGHRNGYKNFEAALRAYASAKHINDAFDFVAFGGHPFSAADKALVAKLSLRQDSVRHLKGSDAELADAYRQAHAFIYPSRYEGFGIPPLEAMSAGCVVACSNTSSIPEVVGDAAVLFDPDDQGSMAEAIERACFDEDLRVRLIGAGHRRTSRFSWDKCAEQTANAYRAALGSGTP